MLEADHVEYLREQDNRFIEKQTAIQVHLTDGIFMMKTQEGATKKIWIFLRLKNFAKSYFRKGYNGLSNV